MGKQRADTRDFTTTTVSDLSPADKRALSIIEREARYLIEQAGHFRANGSAGGNDIRWLFLRQHADLALWVAERGVRRYTKGYEKRKAEALS